MGFGDISDSRPALSKTTREYHSQLLGDRNVAAYTGSWTPVQFNRPNKGKTGALSVQNVSIWQIALILVIVLLLFGVGKLPQVGKGMGQAINEFKSAIGSKTDSPDPDDKSADDNADTKPS